MRTTSRRRVLLAAAATLSPLALTVPDASPVHADPVVQADPVLPINWTVDATTTVKRLNQTVTPPQGTFVGEVNLVSGALHGQLTLPDATAPVKLAGLPLANATFSIAPVGEVTGTVDFATLQVETTSVFNIRLKRLSPIGLPFLNLVGNSCTTATPITLNLSGPVDLAGETTFSGAYTIPQFKTCALATPVLNLLVPGPDNSFSATFAPPA